VKRQLDVIFHFDMLVHRQSIASHQVADLLRLLEHLLLLLLLLLHHFLVMSIALLVLDPMILLRVTYVICRVCTLLSRTLL
jgi:hypothetical protein